LGFGWPSIIIIHITHGNFVAGSIVGSSKKSSLGLGFWPGMDGAEGALADCLATQQFAMAIIRYNLLLSSLQSSCKNAGKNEKREFELGRWEICEKVNKNRKGIYFIYEEQLPLPINMGFHLPK